MATDTLLESVWENSPDGMRLTDSNGIIISVNRAFCVMVSIDRDNLVGHPFTVIYDDSADKVRLRGAYRDRFSNNSIDPFFERGLTLWSGQAVHLEVSTTTVRSETGDRYALSIFRDISRSKKAEEALRQLERAIDSVSGGILIVDVKPDGYPITYCNSAFEQMTGYSGREIIGKGVAGVWRGSVDPIIGKEMAQARKYGKECRVIFQNVRIDGSLFWDEVSMSPVFGADGVLTHFVEIHNDISERKKAEEENTLYQISDKISRAVWENSQDGMALTDEQGTFLKVNQAFCRIVGKDEQDLVGRPFTMVWGEGEIVGRLLKAYASRFESAQLKPLVERRLKLWSGKIVDLEVSGSFLQVNAYHRLLVTIIRDVTERKKEQRALAESERKYHELFENAVQPMFQSGVDGAILAANQALLDLFGYESLEEFRKVRAVDLYVNPEDRTYIANLLRTKNSCTNVELRLKGPDGRELIVLEHSRVIKDIAGKPVMYEGILEDITAQKAMERQLKDAFSRLEDSKDQLMALNAQKDKLFSILSHDLRSPLSSILGFCEILVADRAALGDEQQAEFLGYIRDAASDQLDLVNQLLDWSRLETGRVKFEPSYLTLNKLVQKVMKTLMGLSSPKLITMKSELPSDTQVHGDDQLISQLFFNLLTNALKFTPPGGTICVELIGSRNGNIKIGVRDSGVGIPASDIPKLFRIDEKYTRKGLGGEKGTGLGLPLCAEIMEKHGGQIEVLSEEGKGTTFILTFHHTGEHDAETK